MSDAEPPNMDFIVAGNKGYAADVKRDLYSRGLFNENLEFIVKKFEEKLLSGEVDIETFKEAL